MAALLAALSLSLSGPAAAQSFRDALTTTYVTNPTILAARRELMAVDEQVNIVDSQRYPLVQAQGIISPTQTYVVRDEDEFEDQPFADLDDRVEFDSPQTFQFQINQLIYSFGRVDSQIDEAEAQVAAQRAVLVSVEQQVLLQAGIAYINVARDQGLVELNTNNIRVLTEQQEAAQIRFDVGEVTRTDVEQARARVARSVADRETAQANLRASRAAFTALVGAPPAPSLDLPALVLPIPASLEEAISQAVLRNPAVIGAEAAYAAALAGIDVAASELLPRLDAIANATWISDPQDTVDLSRELEAQFRLRVPIFTGGRDYANIRQSKHIANQRLIEIEQARRDATEQAEAAWEVFQSTAEVIRSREAQVAASQTALEGVREEAVVGSRTTLDVLDAEQELLDAQVNLLIARRDQLEALLQLVAAVGDMRPNVLELDAPTYDPEPAYQASRNKLFSTSVD